MMALSSVVVGDLDFVCTPVGPDEADSVLVVDLDRVLTDSISGQLLETVPRWDPQAVQFRGRVDEAELLLCGSLQVRSEGTDLLSVPDPLGSGVLEGADRESILTCDDSIEQRK
jgi:hypothetical protein